MPLSPSRGDMYAWCDYTINPLRGKCPHNCTYCYVETKMKHRYSLLDVKYSGPLQLDENILKTDLSKAMCKIYRKVNLSFVPKNVPIIFVCSLNDLGVATKSSIVRILDWTRNEPRPFYVFQSKDPVKFVGLDQHFPPNVIIGTTIETNRDTSQFSKAPSPATRALGLAMINCHMKMITIEPIMQFDLDKMMVLVKKIGPSFVSVGANTSTVNLPEPNPAEIHELVTELRKITHVILKDNLKQLYPYESI